MYIIKIESALTRKFEFRWFMILGCDKDTGADRCTFRDIYVLHNSVAESCVISSSIMEKYTVANVEQNVA